MDIHPSPTKSHSITQEPYYYGHVGHEVALTDDDDMIAAANGLIAALF